MTAFPQGLRPLAQRILITLAMGGSLAALTACGGGGGDDNNSARPSSNGTADAYVGTWRSPCLAEEGSGSGYLQAQATRVSANQLRVQWSVRVYTSANCSGSVLQTIDQGTDNATIVGTKTVDGRLVDKIDLTDGSKSLAYTDGSVLMLADDDATSDAQGYPNALDTTLVLTRQ